MILVATAETSSEETPIHEFQNRTLSGDEKERFAQSQAETFGQMLI
jgi:hypothetical protein